MKPGSKIIVVEIYLLHRVIAIIIGVFRVFCFAIFLQYK